MGNINFMLLILDCVCTSELSEAFIKSNQIKSNQIMRYQTSLV